MFFQQIPFIYIALICAVVAIVVATLLNPYILLLAYRKHLTDAPNYRKLHRKPVPVLGGGSVYAAMIIGLFICNLFHPMDELFTMVTALTIMFYVGFFDDMMEMSYRFKFLCQIIVVLGLCVCDVRIKTFQGVFGIYDLPTWLSYLVSLITGVGLMNAINLMDGVDGLSSSFGILTCAICATFFYHHGEPMGTAMGCVLVGALLPFLVCNVFSRKYKMFIGDSGTLILGTVAYIFTCRIMRISVMDANDHYKVAMLVAMNALPVFDTLRVMSIRMLHGNSPFKPDRTHLHHIFVELGYPHFMVTLILMALELMVIIVWYITARCMPSITWQLLVVVAAAVLLIAGTYGILRHIRQVAPKRFERMVAKVKKHCRVPLLWYHTISNLFDGKYYRRWKMKRRKRG